MASPLEFTFFGGLSDAEHVWFKNWDESESEAHPAWRGVSIGGPRRGIVEKDEGRKKETYCEILLTTGLPETPLMSRGAAPRRRGSSCCRLLG
jgi:hypothetical protein